MKSRADGWTKEALDPNRELVYDKHGAGATAVPLMESPGMKAWQTWTVPMSMREVEPGVRLILQDRDLSSTPDWQPRKNNKKNEGEEL